MLGKCTNQVKPKSFYNCLMIMILAALLSGCKSTSAIPHKSLKSNASILQQKLFYRGIKTSVGNINTAPEVQENLVCRSRGPLEITPGKTLSQYIKEALKEELILANVYQEDSKNVLEGEIQALSFTSVSPANWDITMTIKSNNSTGYSISVKYPFKTHFRAYPACNSVAAAFSPAVQELINQVLNDSRFNSLFNENTSPL